MLLRVSFIPLFLILLASTALGQGPPEKRGWDFPEKKGGNFEDRRGRPGPMYPPMQEWVRRLNLTGGQTAKLQTLRHSYLRDTLVWRNELAVKRFDLQDLLQNPQAEDQQILARQREVSELEGKIQERTILHQLEIRKVLTPEQIKLIPPDFGWGGLHGPRMMRGHGRRMSID